MSRNTAVKWYWRQNRHARRRTLRSAILTQIAHGIALPIRDAEVRVRGLIVSAHGMVTRSKISWSFFLPLSYELSYIFCLAVFRSGCLNIPIITCAMSVCERKCRGRCGAGIRLPENARERQWQATWHIRQFIAHVVTQWVFWRHYYVDDKWLNNLATPSVQPFVHCGLLLVTDNLYGCIYSTWVIL